MCALSTCTSHAHILYLSKGHNPDEIRALSWNIMGDTHEGWATVRSVIVHPNIQGYDIVFLQEVQWVEDDTKDRIATPGFDPTSKKSKNKTSTPLFEVALTRSKCKKRNICILYKPDRLQREDADSVTVTQTLRSVAGWKDEYSKRLCVQVFTLKGKGDTSKFVAISLHAPRTDTETYCNTVKKAIGRVVAKHKVPVIVGGDFNTDIYDWKYDHFLGVHKTRHKRIDFIIMKVPSNNHLEIGHVMPIEDIDISAGQDLRFRRNGKVTKVSEYKEDYTYEFYQHLCDSHMPLTVPIKWKRRSPS